MSENLKVDFDKFQCENEISDSVVFLNKEKISIGKGIEIKGDTSIVVNEKFYNKNLNFNIKIDDYVFINKYVALEAFNYIEIGKYVAIASKVYISDSNHEYTNIYTPIAFQGFRTNNNKIVIKDGAWIGNGACIIGNVTIGYGAVIGANAIITKDVPDHSVVVGNPSKIIKIFDYREK